ncbi:chemokine-like receptor 1 [Megalops cyprinoides]|uniref:chemokine-like receptor 1 n=1 Tax=Megalops cyprinoides TaxID=118141 RepID=UPI00186560FB|nr:chemokine-like receptor 1 [Megalops cyprinoides]
MATSTLPPLPFPEYQEGKSTIDTLEIVMDKVLIVLYTLTIILGITGNSVVIWVAGFRLPSTVTSVWLVNLAVADLIFCLTRVVSLAKKLFFSYWPFGIFLCKFNGFFKYANMFCSVFLLSVISVDRALCVWRPVLTKQRRTLGAARLVSVGVWVASVTLSSPYFAFRQTYTSKNNLTKCSMEVKDREGDISSSLALYILRFLCGFLLPFLVILCCYTLAAMGIRRTRLTRKRKPLKILASLVCAFFLCWAPYHCLLLVKMVNSKSQVVKIGLPLSKGIAYFNSCINPLLYFFMGLDFRRRFQQGLSEVYRNALAEVEGPTAQSDEGQEKTSASTTQAREAVNSSASNVAAL